MSDIVEISTATEGTAAAEPAPKNGIKFLKLFSGPVNARKWDQTWELIGNLSLN